MKQAVTFEWYDHAHQYQRTLAEELGAALFGLSPVGVDSWPVTLAANLAMGALLCAAHRRGWSEGWRAGAPARWGTRWEDFDYASTPEQGDEP